MAETAKTNFTFLYTYDDIRKAAERLHAYYTRKAEKAKARFDLLKEGDSGWCEADNDYWYSSRKAQDFLDYAGAFGTGYGDKVVHLTIDDIRFFKIHEILEDE